MAVLPTGVGARYLGRVYEAGSISPVNKPVNSNERDVSGTNTDGGVVVASIAVFLRFVVIRRAEISMTKNVSV